MKKQTISFSKWKLTAPYVSPESAWDFQEGIILHLKETSTRVAQVMKGNNEKVKEHILEQEEKIASLEGQVAQLKKEVKELSE